jgi:hypothetical protein
MTSHVQRAGVVIAVAETREAAIVRADAAIARVRVVTVPAPTAQSAMVH